MTVISVAKGEKYPRLETITCNGLEWIYIEQPTQKETDYLTQRFSQFHRLNLEDCLSKIQRPKIDEYDDHIFIVLHFPVFNKETRVTNPSEVDIFVGKNFLVTVHCSSDLKPLTRFFNECLTDEATRQRCMGRGSGFLLYQVIDRLVDYCFPMLNKVIDNTENIEDRVFTQPTPSTVQEIMVVRRDIISFRRIVHPQVSVIKILESKDYPFLGGGLEHYFGDIGDHLSKILDGLDDYREVANNLADTSNWLTSHRIQEVMRVLTILVAIISPATLIASIYGMNVPLPGGIEKGNPLTLLILLVIMFLIALGMFFYFRRKRWI